MVPATEPGATDGVEMFARYVYAPNSLGYCGPAEAAGLRGASQDRVRSAAPQFSGVWPYLQVMATMTGIDDPLDHRLVESYWLGGGVGARLDAAEFAAELLAVIGPVAGRYWTHLTPGLAAEAAPDHCFHVFGVYPWSWMLGKGMDEHAVQVLDGCRITWGTVIGCAGENLTVQARHLTWDGDRLSLSAPKALSVIMAPGYVAAEPGDVVAVHWGQLCGRLEPEQARALASSTARQLRATNRRLAMASRVRG